MLRPNERRARMDFCKRSFEPMDSFGFTAQLHHTARFPLLGKCLEVRSNSADVLRVAHQAFGHWLLLAEEARCAQETLCLDVVVMDKPHDETQTIHPLFEYRLHGHTFIATAGDDMMTAQLDRGYAIAFVAPALVANTLYLRKQVLDTLGLLLTTQHDREPIHAGAVAWQGKAILFAGKSKVGKSTLCYACAQAGFDLIAEDVVYLQRQPDLCLWGHATHIHLLPDAPRFFPELKETPAQLQPNGKTKLAVCVPNRRLFATQGALCIIERSASANVSQSILESISTDAALAALFEGVDEGFDLYPFAKLAAAGWLSKNPAYRLHLGTDVNQTVQALQRL